MYYESDFELECDECGPGPPPVFNIPPPPRPDFLQNELGASTSCSENLLSDYDMCEAIPILDASYHSGPSLQTSAMILLCSVLLLIFIFVSSILIWKHKRKVQNFLPCKTPSRNALDPSVIPVGQSLTYEDPDMHLGHHRPLVMRQHPLNAELLHSKGIQYPSGYPIQRSPPLFICSSPGPEPYRSNDNVYEELEHRGNNRYQNCDRQMHSDEDFAEDELSLPGDRSLNKSSSENTTVATIYQEHGAGSTSSNNGNENSAMYMERNRLERNSLLSSASSNDNSNNNVMRPNMKNSSSTNESNSRRMQQHHNLYHNTLNSQNNDKNANNSVNNNNNNSSNISSGMSNFFRFRTSRPNNGCSSSSKSKNNNHHHRGGGGKTNNFSMNNLNSSGCDEIPLSSYHVGGSSSSAASNSDPISCSSNANHIDGDTNNNNNSNNGGNSGRNNYYGIDSEVERRNRINAQLSAATPTLNVATIFRDRNSMRNYHHNHQNINNNNNNNNNSSNTTETRANANYYVPQQHIMMMAANRNDANNRLSRTNPRTDRRHNNNNNSSNNNNNLNNNDEYLYHEPVYHENMVYDPYIISSDNRNQLYHQPYMLPEFTTFRNCNNLNNPQQPLYNSSTTGAMNSDSGYSQNTQNSGHSLWNRRKRSGGTNNNNDNENGDSITSTVRGETTATDDTYECS